MSGNQAAYWSTETILMMTKGLRLCRRLNTDRKKVMVEKIAQYQANKHSLDPAALIRTLLEKLCNGETELVGEGTNSVEANIPQKDVQRTTSWIPLPLLKKLIGDAVSEDPIVAMQYLESRIQEWMRILNRYAPEEDNLDGAINSALSRFQNSEAAVKSASQESIGRLLQAISPEQIKKGVEKGPTKIGPFLKAAWFDTFEEKYGQLIAYHSKGFLARDLRDMYKRHLKNLQSE